MGYRDLLRALRARWITQLGAAVLLCIAIGAGPAVSARASCNIIPGTARTFRGDMASLDRPFAEPGSWVELSTASTCHAQSPGFSALAADNVVTVVFKSPLGDASVVVLAASCQAIASQLTACQAAPQVASAACIDAEVAGSAPDLEVLLAGNSRNLRFRFPDTDLLFDGVDNDRTLSGPAAIAVSPMGEPLPCTLASQACAAQSGLAACVDEIYSADGACGKVPHAKFSHFTSLPPANDYQALCSRPSPPCLGSASEIRVTVDRDGNLMIPMLWDGILVNPGEPIARMLRGSAAVEPFSGSGGAITIPGDAFLESFSPEGGPLLPVFDPQNDAQATQAVTLFGSADASRTILRVARRSSSFRQCAGGLYHGLPCEQPGDCPAGLCGATSCASGANQGQPCAADADCAGGECGPSLFELRDRARDGRGPIIVPRFPDPSRIEAGVCETAADASVCFSDGDCAAGDRCVVYSLEAQDAVSLDSILVTDELLALVVSEQTSASDLNGDGDSVDSVVLLKDRSTGILQSLGSPSQCGLSSVATGRAVLAVATPPFSAAAVAVSGDTLAFLESEAGAGGCDISGDGDAADAIVRVFRLGASELAATNGGALSADAAAVIDGESLVVSAGRVFYRNDAGVLSVLEVAGGAPSELCRAAEVSVSGGQAAFLRPETPSAEGSCAVGSLNGDSDEADLVVYRWSGGEAESLGRAASRVALSGSWLAALVSESGQADAGVDLNGDGDVVDDVVAAHASADAAGTWIDIGQAAETLELRGSTLAFATAEASQAQADLNGDGDVLDTVLRVYDADSGLLDDTALAVEEFVLGANLLAFRSSEAAQGADLNADGDLGDEVLQVYDLASGAVVNTGQTAVPCDQVACDPRTPYRVLDDTIRFVTLESLQGEDLNGDGDADDLILQIFNAAMAFNGASSAALTAGRVEIPHSRTAMIGDSLHAGYVTALGSVDTLGPASALMSGEQGGVAYTDVGRCVEILAASCAADLSCGGGQVCGAEGRCERGLGPCRSDGDCPAAAHCRAEAVVVTAADSDGDELPDPFDNCPNVANILQRDHDRDGIGDACQVICGDGIVQPGQDCDGQSYCKADCTLRACGDPTDSGRASAASALFVLKAAVGLQPCDDCVCNVNGLGATDTSDALLLLRHSVGLGGALHCPRCDNPLVAELP